MRDVRGDCCGPFLDSFEFSSLGKNYSEHMFYPYYITNQTNAQMHSCEKVLKVFFVFFN